MIGSGPWPIAWIVRGAALAVASGLVYLIARRAGPRLGASAAAWGLGLLAALPALLLLPWPRWELPIGPVPDGSPPIADRDRPAIGEGVGVAPPLDGLGPAAGVDVPAPDVVPLRIEGASDPPRDADAGDRALPDGDWPRRALPWRDGIAIGLGTLVGLGFARLAVGLGAVVRLRGRARPIDDPAIVALVEGLRDELSVVRAVGLLESSELDTPATLGWRRPAILLPDDWRSWDAIEIRAVLAHEMAHVRGADAAVALLARLGVALHPYNPMVHWLSGRLRLDQELAADATAARLSGGRQPYLTCLARLALRRDDRAAGWPARAFLPVRGTFVRRIEMLRDDRSTRPEGPNRPLRVLAVSALAASALLCAGVRGPSGPDAARAQQQRANAEKVPEGFDLSAVPPDASAVVAIKAATLAAQPELKPLIEEFQPIARMFGGLDLPIETLDQLTLVEMRRQEARGPGLLQGAPDLFILEVTEPINAGVVPDILGDFEAVGFLGISYSRSLSRPLAAYTPDDRTVVVAAQESTLRTLIAGRNRPAGAQLWTKAAEEVGDGQLLVAFETPWLVQLLDAEGGPPGGLGGPIAVLGPMLDQTYAYAIGLDVTGGTTFDAVALCGDEAGAKRVAETASALKTLARNALGSLRTGLGSAPPDAAEAMVAIADAAEGLLDSATIGAEGSAVTIRAESDLELADLIRLAAPPIASARMAARRVQAMNNLKQIGLALHNYHDANGSFPPPVLHSENGTPYSWRVAILPYLEQMQAYDRYRFDEPWDGPNNRALLEQMPPVFNVSGSDNDPTHADYFALVGPMTLMGEPGKGTSLSDITDGSSNTLMIVESRRPVPWTKPEDIPIDLDSPAAGDAVPELGGFWSNGFQTVFGDGAARFISATIDPMTLRALVTRNGGEAISAEAY